MIALLVVLVLSGASAQPKIGVHAQDREGRTPLMNALAKGAPLDEIKILIERGSDLKATDLAGRTPLLNAKLDSDYIPVIEFLISKGADFKAKDLEGMGVVQISTCSDRRIYEFWKSKGLNLNEEAGRTSAISECLRRCNEDAIKYLLSQGARRPTEWEKLAAQYNCNNKVRSLFN